MQGDAMAGDAVVHLEIYDEHQREEDEEGADGKREALLQLHVEHGARGLAARRVRTARMVRRRGRRRPLTVACARRAAPAPPPPPPPRARPPAYAATTGWLNKLRAVELSNFTPPTFWVTSRFAVGVTG